MVVLWPLEKYSWSIYNLNIYVYRNHFALSIEPIFSFPHEKNVISTLITATFLNNCVEEEKWNGLCSTKRPKCIPFPAPLSSPSLLERGVTMETQGSFLIGCQDEVRVTRKVETRRCRGWYFFLLFLPSPLSLLSVSVLPHCTLVSVLWLLPALLTDSKISST